MYTWQILICLWDLETVIFDLSLGNHYLWKLFYFIFYLLIFWLFGWWSPDIFKIWAVCVGFKIYKKKLIFDNSKIVQWVSILFFLIKYYFFTVIFFYFFQKFCLKYSQLNKYNIKNTLFKISYLDTLWVVLSSKVL